MVDFSVEGIGWKIKLDTYSYWKKTSFFELLNHELYRYEKNVENPTKHMTSCGGQGPKSLSQPTPFRRILHHGHMA